MNSEVALTLSCAVCGSPMLVGIEPTVDRTCSAHGVNDRTISLLIRPCKRCQAMVEKGTKAWASVKNASEWVDYLRGND